MLHFIPFFLTLSDCIYSLINLFQYILDRLYTTFHLCWLSISFLYISTTLCAFKDCPDIKWFGVNTVKSSVLSLIDVKGLLLIVPSIWTRVVINWSLLVDYLSLISMPFLSPSLMTSKLHPSMDYLVVWSATGYFGLRSY